MNQHKLSFGAPPPPPKPALKLPPVPETIPLESNALVTWQIRPGTPEALKDPATFDIPPSISEWPADKRRPHPTMSYCIGELRELDPEHYLIDVARGPYPTYKRAVGSLMGVGFTSVWSAKGDLIFCRRDFVRPELVHGCQVIPEGKEWIIKYAPVLGRPYYSDDPGAILEGIPGIPPFDTW